MDRDLVEQGQRGDREAFAILARSHGRPDGTDQREISAIDEEDEANAPFWSPDGKYLLVARDSDATVDGPHDLWIMDLDGNYLSQVTDEPSIYGTYSWAPTTG